MRKWETGKVVNRREKLFAQAIQYDDTNNHVIVAGRFYVEIFDIFGVLLTGFGCNDAFEFQLGDAIAGLAIHDGRIYVCEHSNSKIEVFG